MAWYRVQGHCAIRRHWLTAFPREGTTLRHSPRFRLGPQLIALMGHTRPAPSLSRTYLDVRFPTLVLVSAELGGNERALGALARFGVGAVEVGPVALEAGAPPRIERRPEEGVILLY